MIRFTFIVFLLNIYDFILGYIITKNTETFEDRMDMFRISYLNLISPQGMNILLLTLCLLSVLLRVTGIFTGTTVSLSPWLRQWGNRYAIRAGRNLPDKEFRYLRTVIVTAAVYWGFDLKLRLR